MKKTIAAILIILLSIQFNAGIAIHAEQHSDEEFPNFGYSGYDVCENILSFEEKINLPRLEFEDYINSLPGLCNYPDPYILSIAWDVFDYAKNKMNLSNAQKKYWTRLENVIHSSPIVLIVNPDTEKQIQYITKYTIDDGDNSLEGTRGFTITSSSVKRILRNESSVKIDVGDTVWVRENYWTDGYYISYRDRIDEMIADYAKFGEDLPESVKATIDPIKMEENPIIYIKGQFRAEYFEGESPLYEGETLVFAEIDKDAKGALVLKINDLFKFKIKDSIKYDTPVYDYQKMIGTLIGDAALNCFDLESNLNFPSIDTGVLEPIDPYYEPTDLLTEQTTTPPAESEVPTSTPSSEPKEQTTTPPAESEEPTPAPSAETEAPTSTPPAEPKEQTPTPPAEPKEQTPTPPDESAWILPSLIGFGVGVLVCLVPTAIVLVLRRRQRRDRSDRR